MGAQVMQGGAQSGLHNELVTMRDWFEERLRQVLGDADQADLLQQAMREAALSAGKRMRPLLMMLLARDLGRSAAGMLDAACAVEMVHAASLVLDDMPCMDNALLRRGRPAVHVRFGEDVAILASISLLSRAFGLVSAAPGISASARAHMSSTLADAVGAQGLAKGQYQDLRVGSGERSCDDIAVTNELKTGVLFGAAVSMAAIVTGSDDSVALPLQRFARAAGQAFQIRDDLQDGPENDVAVTGKDIGKDVGKATLVATLGAEQARRQLAALLEEADQHLTSALGEGNHTGLFFHALFADQASCMPHMPAMTVPLVNGAAFAGKPF
jgi:geranylgeranyl diphosphate synthase type II